jgi:hypothetical protein
MLLLYTNQKRTVNDSAGVPAIAVVAQENVAVDCQHNSIRLSQKFLRQAVLARAQLPLPSSTSDPSSQ